MLDNIPAEVQTGVKALFREGNEVGLIDFFITGGGCINQGGKLRTTNGDFFIKWNDRHKFPLMFKTEARGLETLRNEDAIGVPRVIGHGESGSYQFLLLEFVEPRDPSPSFWEKLGHQLASVHQIHGNAFGLDHDNYIGSLPQYNRENTSWADFFLDQRLEIQLKLAADAGLISLAEAKNFDVLFSKLPSLLPYEEPSLVHGDLWSGNILSGPSGNPYLIDPAVYYGNREADLAMTLLFGGFRDRFYSAYAETYPLLPGYKNRVDFYNLYPLLVHLNLFGRQYLSRIKTILDGFI